MKRTWLARDTNTHEHCHVSSIRPLKNNFVRMKKIAILSILLFSILTIQAANAIWVSGTVSDNQGLVIPGVYVMEKGTSNGTVSDANGFYKILVKASGTLTFSFVGFDSKMVSVDGKTQINVTLIPSKVALSEVVVVGYGTQPKSVLTGAVS